MNPLDRFFNSNGENTELCEGIRREVEKKGGGGGEARQRGIHIAEIRIYDTSIEVRLMWYFACTQIRELE
jgi:hypothetical protein